MVFNSFEFFGFFAVIIFLYGYIKQQYRWIYLLIISLTFYAFAGIPGLIFIGVTSLTTWYAARRIASTVSKGNEVIEKKKKAWLISTLLLNLGILCVVKYTNFIVGGVSQLIRLEYTPISFFIPLGISFCTFQTVGYLIDVYQEKIEPQGNYFKLLLFTCFFPQMIDGPISRYEQISEALYNSKAVEYKRCKEALLLFAWGLFKKICIADNIKPFVDLVYGNYSSYHGISILLGAIGYAIYIYADFSGCIDMARGCGCYFGIELPQNFSRPYFACSVEEFWRRWHITLSQWFKDYLFYPLQRSRLIRGLSDRLVKKNKFLSKIIPTSIAMLFVWMTTGIWHGAKMTYILWGLYYGILMVIGFIIPKVRSSKNKKKMVKAESRPRKMRVVNVCVTFLLVSLGYILFYADSASAATRMFINLLDVKHLVSAREIYNLGVSYYKTVGGTIYLAVTVISTLILVIVDFLFEFSKAEAIRMKFSKCNVAVKYIIAVSAVFILMFMMNRSAGDFTYMQF